MAFQETDRIPLYDLLFCDEAIEHFSGEKLPKQAFDEWAMKEADRPTFANPLCSLDVHVPTGQNYSPALTGERLELRYSLARAIHVSETNVVRRHFPSGCNPDHTRRRIQRIRSFNY